MAHSTLTPEETERAARLLCEGIDRRWDEEDEKTRAGYRKLVGDLWNSLKVENKTPESLLVFMAWVGGDDEMGTISAIGGA